jgi:hypothetical protein
MQVYDACVQALTGEGLIVIPNCHILDSGWCCAADDGNGLWYNTRWPAGKFFSAWQDIATRYQANPLVAAMDIMNEPRRTMVGWRVLTPWTGAGGHSTRRSPRAPSRSPTGTGPTGAIPNRWGLLAPDWRGVANPGVLDLLKSMIPPRTGPGLAEGSRPATP